MQPKRRMLILASFRPSWLAFIGHTSDSLWSVDLFRCESIVLRSYWLSHPFVERLIGTVRREFLDHVLFWNVRDLERKLTEFQVYYNEERSHASLNGHTPLTFATGHTTVPADLNHVRWVSHCRDLVQLPIAA